MAKTYQELSTEANKIYHFSKSTAELSKTLRELKTEIAAGWLNKVNHENLLALAYRIEFKLLLLQYFTDFDESNLQQLTAVVEKFVQDFPENSAPKTQSIGLNVAAFMEQTHIVMKGYAQLKKDIDSAATQTVEEYGASCDEFTATLDEMIAAMENIGDESTLFGKQVSLPNLHNQTLATLNDTKSLIANKKAEKIRVQSKAFLQENATLWDKTNGAYSSYNFYPGLPEGNTVNAMILHTPFKEEALLMILYNGSGEAVEIDASIFKGKSKHDIDQVCRMLESVSGELIVRNLEAYADKNKPQVIKSVVGIARSKKVYILELSGHRQLTDDVATHALGEVCEHYLTMPDYEGVTALFKDKKMIDGSENDDEFVRANMPLIGFIGLNKVLSEYAASRNWRQLATNLTKKNFTTAMRYIRNVDNRALLLDDGWGDIQAVQTGRGQFDYDGLAEVDQRNINKIMSYPDDAFSAFARCGCVVRYALLAGADKREWELITEEERHDRLTQAVKMLYKAMNIHTYDPLVTFHPDLGKAGAYCCGGGKEIQYCTKWTDDYEYMFTTTCHEVYHAFQHMLETSEWDEKYFILYGITRGEVEEMKENHKHYMGIEADFNSYRYQMIEAGANAFEIDCTDGVTKYWNLIDFD